LAHDTIGNLELDDAQSPNQHGMCNYTTTLENRYHDFIHVHFYSHCS